MIALILFILSRGVCAVFLAWTAWQYRRLLDIDGASLLVIIAAVLAVDIAYQSVAPFALTVAPQVGTLHDAIHGICYFFSVAGHYVLFISMSLYFYPWARAVGKLLGMETTIERSTFVQICYLFSGALVLFALRDMLTVTRISEKVVFGSAFGIPYYHNKEGMANVPSLKIVLAVTMLWLGAMGWLAQKKQRWRPLLVMIASMATLPLSGFPADNEVQMSALVKFLLGTISETIYMYAVADLVWVAFEDEMESVGKLPK